MTLGVRSDESIIVPDTFHWKTKFDQMHLRVCWRYHDLAIKTDSQNCQFENELIENEEAFFRHLADLLSMSYQAEPELDDFLGYRLRDGR